MPRTTNRFAMDLACLVRDACRSLDPDPMARLLERRYRTSALLNEAFRQANDLKAQVQSALADPANPNKQVVEAGRWRAHIVPGVEVVGIDLARARAYLEDKGVNYEDFLDYALVHRVRGGRLQVTPAQWKPGGPLSGLPLSVMEAAEKVADPIDGGAVPLDNQGA